MTGVGADEVPLDARASRGPGGGPGVRAARRAAARAAPELRELHPARRWARIVRGGHRRRPAARPGTARAAGGAQLSDDEVLRLATEMEGHPDNVAPALFGGFTLAFLETTAGRLQSGARCTPDIRVVVFSAASGQFDPSHPRAAAGDRAARRRQRQRGGRRPAGARDDRRPVLPAAGTSDRLHQDYRAPAMPESARLVARPAAGGNRRRDLRRRAIGDRAGHRIARPERWRRPGFEVAEVAVCTAGARSSLSLTCRHARTAVAQADDVRLLLKAITGCARCDVVMTRVCEPDINGGGLKKPSPLPP